MLGSPILGTAHQPRHETMGMGSITQSSTFPQQDMNVGRAHCSLPSLGAPCYHVP